MKAFCFVYGPPICSIFVADVRRLEQVADEFHLDVMEWQPVCRISCSGLIWSAHWSASTRGTDGRPSDANSDRHARGSLCGGRCESGHYPS